MTASAALTISPMLSSALGFSILAISQARPPTRARRSSISLARCTNDSAIQSTPSDRPNSRSAMSLVVSGLSGRMVSGTLTPLRALNMPPVTTRVSIWDGVLAITSSLTRPSSSSSDAPGLILAW
ncbi:hypothetical protein D3C87_1645270 [compost metagenome]